MNAEEQNNSVPDNQTAEYKRKNKNKEISYLILLGMSILSALAITALWTTFPSGNLGLAGILPFFLILMVQLILVVPATLLISFVHSKLTHQNKLAEVQPSLRVGIPLIFNILAAFSYFIMAFVIRLQQNISGFNLSRNVIVTIKEETITPPGSSKIYENSYIYRAALHVENNSGDRIPQMIFFIGAYDQGDLKWPYANAHGIGSGQLSNSSRYIPPGTSDIIIDLFIQSDVLKCHNSNLDKPLYFLYNLIEQYQSVPVSNRINQELKKIACSSTP